MSSQIQRGSTIKAPPPDSPHGGQLVASDDGETDLGDLQYVLFNTVALVFFFGEFLRAPYLGLPDLPDLLVGLTSVSALGYLGKKVITTAGPAINTVDPESGKVGAEVRIGGPGLIDGSAPPKEVRFATKAAGPIVVRQTPAGPVAVVTVPEGVSGQVPLYVTTSNDIEAKWDKLFSVVDDTAAAAADPEGAPLVPVTDAAPEADAAPVTDAAADSDAADGSRLESDAAADSDAADGSRLESDAAAESDAAIESDAAVDGEAAVDGDAAAENEPGHEPDSKRDPPGV